MTNAFLIVVAVALTLKLFFLSFSLYFTLKKSKKDTQNDPLTKTESMKIAWGNIIRMFLPKAVYCPEANKNSFPYM